MRELQILTPDGQTRSLVLDRDRFVLGRSSSVELSFPDDGGLSRQHLVIESPEALEAQELPGNGHAGHWFLQDLDSKNGTTLNGNRITGRTPLTPGDRIGAGHLVLVYDPAGRASKPVVVFDHADLDTAPFHLGQDTRAAGDIQGLSMVVEQLEGAPGKDVRGDPETLAATHISALIRAGNELAGHRPLQELFPFILNLSIDAVQADRGLLMTLENGELVPQANRGEGFRISTAVRDRVLNTGVSVLVRDTSIDVALRERRSIVEQNIRTLMAVPLQTRDQIIGIIYVDSPSLLREFTRDDLNLLTVMANVAAIRIEHTRFLEVESARQLLARDLEQAAEIQQRFLPSVAPTIRGLDLAGHNAPCRTVGGDYYDFFPYENTRVAMALGDVSGKGMPASLLMMGLQARVQVLIEEPKSLADVMTRLNRITSANCPSNRFITLFFCILDGETGDLTYCNAGHNRPLIIRADGTEESVPGAGPVVGILPYVEYPEFQMHLGEGDVLVIYSDGVTEAASPAGVDFGTEGLAAVVTAHRHEPAAAIVSAVNKAVAAHTGGAPPSDDITLIVARRTGP